MTQIIWFKPQSVQDSTAQAPSSGLSLNPNVEDESLLCGAHIGASSFSNSKAAHMMGIVAARKGVRWGDDHLQLRRRCRSCDWLPTGADCLADQIHDSLDLIERYLILPTVAEPLSFSSCHGWLSRSTRPACSSASCSGRRSWPTTLSTPPSGASFAGCSTAAR